MTTKDTRYTPEQMQLVSEFTQDYGINPDQMTFFGDDPRPTFDAEAGAHLVRTLANAVGVAIGPAAISLPDTIRMECGLTFPNNFFSSGTGSAHVKEKIDGVEMSLPQVERLAASRAMRSALVYAGIDLLKLHRQRRSGVVQFTGPDKSNRERLLARVHVLGHEVGLIDGENKSAWKGSLQRMYGVDSAAGLQDAQLEDFAAWISSLRPQTGVAKAA